MTPEVIARPADEPLTLSGVKGQLVIQHDEDNALLSDLIKLARVQAEEDTRRALITQTLRLTLECFTDEIQLPRPPLQSVSSINYIDEDKNPQLLDAAEYVVDTTGVIGRIRPVTAWPSITEGFGAVIIEYVAGYGDSAADIPMPILHGMLINITDWYEHRGARITGVSVAETNAGQSLIKPYWAGQL